MPANYTGATTVVTIDPSGTPTVVNGKVLHFQTCLGARPNEFVVLWLGKTPSTVTMASYLGKACTLTINSTLVCTGIVGKSRKYDLQGNLGVVFTVVDGKHQINAGYIGQNFLEALDTDSSSPTYGTATSFSNGLAWYGEDICFNKGGMPNKSKSSLAFNPPPFEHNTSQSDYWTYGQALEWLWQYCIQPVTGFAMPTVGGLNPSSWTFGGMDKKLDQFGPLLRIPMAECIDALLEKTRVQWTIDGSGVAKFFAIGQYIDTLTLTYPTDPSSDDQTCPFDMDVEVDALNAVTQLDIIGGKQQREVLLGTQYTGSVYTGDLALTSTDFTQTQWFGIDSSGGWLTFDSYVIPMGTLAWSNYNRQRYLHTYLNNYGWITALPNEYMYRYNFNPNIYETHRVGKNIAANDQPYRMLPELLVARDKDGNFINPDQENAMGGVSPMELLKYQYDQVTIDLDRGYILASGVSPFVVNPLEFIAKPYFATSNPNNLTIAFECSYRAYVSQSTAISGMPYTVRRAVIRDELIHKTREQTKIIFPEVALFDALGNVTLSDGVSLPTGWTKDFSNTTSIPLQPANLTARPPAGVVVNGMAELEQVKSNVAPYVGKYQITGSFYLPGFVFVKVGTNVLDSSGNYEIGTDCIVTAVAFNDEAQKTEIQFVSRLGIDITTLANQFVDQRGFRVGV